MRIITLCAVLSVLLAESLASPLKIEIRDASKSLEIVESVVSSEIKEIEDNLSSLEDEKLQEIEQDTAVDKTSVQSSEKQSDKQIPDHDETSENSSEEDKYESRFARIVNDNEGLKVEHSGKAKRNVDATSHKSNLYAVKDQNSIKHDKYLKQKRFSRAVESDESKDFQDVPPHVLLRHERGADTSEDSSSSEESHAGKGLVINKTSETDPTASEHKPEGTRRRRNTASTESSEENSSEEAKQKSSSAKPNADPAFGDINPIGSIRKRNVEVYDEQGSKQDQDVNEVFIFSNEQQQDSEENLNSNNLKSNKYFITIFNAEKSDIYQEKKISEEDYAQGCGGNSSNQDDNDTIDDYNENNETTSDKF